MGYLGRDFEVMTLEVGGHLVIACDSSGGIGSKVLDLVKTSPQIVGAFTARVALLEVLAAGAMPSMISVTISCEPNPTGQQIMEGISSELASYGLNSVPMIISTEKNVKTSQTGLGVTVIGTCGTDEIRVGKSKVGDQIFCLGLPKVGYEVLKAAQDEIAKPSDILALLRHEEIGDIVPVGSSGIIGEIGHFLSSTDTVLKGADHQGSVLFEECGVSHINGIGLRQSAGPSSCILFSCHSAEPPSFTETRIVKIAEIIKNDAV